MIKEAISKLINKENLSPEMASEVMEQIMQGKATGSQIAAYLTALRLKGETIDEITASATVMRRHSTKINPGRDVLEIVGTGGDGTNTFNISTVSSLVISAAGIPVAKHGNRSVSSKCGSADVLEALGVKIELTAQQSAAILNEIDICFMFAPIYHASMKYAAPVRREIGIRTIFNILGPLSNPAGATFQLMGVYNENLVEPLARVLANLGVKRAMVVCGNDGMDEVTLCGFTTVCEVNDGKLNSFILDPRQFGFELCRPEDLTGGGPAENAEIALSILKGEKGPRRDVVLLNSALCLYMFYNNITLRDCVDMAAEIIESGKALKKLEDFIRISNAI